MTLASIIIFYILTARALTFPANPSILQSSFIQEIVVVTKYVFVGCSTSGIPQLPTNTLAVSSFIRSSGSETDQRSTGNFEVHNQKSPDGLGFDLSTPAKLAEPTSAFNDSEDPADQGLYTQHSQRPAQSYLYTLQTISSADAKPLVSIDRKFGSISTTTDYTEHTESSVVPDPSPSVLTTSLSTPVSESKIQETIKPSGLPFRSIVAFGDNLSDNGNGSYAHKVTSSPGEDNKVYGYGTWTDHQVAVSYLADLLHCPLTKDFAFGHAWGGSASGATVDDTLYFSDFRTSKSSPPYFPTQFSSPCNGAPSSKVQIADYVKDGVDSDVLHFLWIGNNDVNMETMIQKSDTFATAYASKVTDQVQTLRDAGAEYVIVVNIYAKHLAPVLPAYYGWTTPEQKDAFATFISDTNAALQTSLAFHYDVHNVLYYDVFSFMQSLWNDGASHGFTNKLDVNGQPACCDDDKALTKEVKLMYAEGKVKGMTEESNWGVCVKQEKWAEWFWMQNLDMTSAVHKFIAKDMSERIEEHWTR